MSLVEKALKKLQEARLSAAAGSGRVAEKPIPITAGSVERFEATQLLTSAEQSPAPRPSAVIAERVVRRSDKLVHIDRAALRAAGLTPPEEQQRQLASEYRQIKRPLISAALGKGMERLENGRIMMIASSLPGEGKTFTSINLALSISLEKDVTVLLADADLAKPHISRTFGVEKEPGLVEALLDNSVDIESAVIPTDVPGLSILPAGHGVETATELLASSRMEQVAARLSAADPTRIILFDSPPLLLTSEARVLASIVGQIVLVVRAGFTPRSAVSESLAQLGEGAPINLILNQSENATPASYYGYGRYGDYGYPAQNGAANGEEKES